MKGCRKADWERFNDVLHAVHAGNDNNREAIDLLILKCYNTYCDQFNAVVLSTILFEDRRKRNSALSAKSCSPPVMREYTTRKLILYLTSVLIILIST